jgi:hypothetical protein
MSYTCNWLPPLVLLEEYCGEWEKYIEAIYNCFKIDFIDSKPKFEEKDVSIVKYPAFQNKECGFWHITSEGRKENERIPDIRRCERICWPKPIIEQHNDIAIRCWRNTRGQGRKIILWLYEQDYIVVLTERKTYVILWTAYPITFDNTRKKLQKEYEDSQKG